MIRMWAIVLLVTVGSVTSNVNGATKDVFRSDAYKKYAAWKVMNPWWGTFCHGIHMNEADGDLHPTPGDNGISHGPLQIQRRYWADAGIPGNYRDINDLEVARFCMWKYMQRYAPTELRTKKMYIMARVHNGGPGGRNNAMAKAYADKFLRQLK